MSKVIAVVRLAAGRVAFYDDLSRIHLTINNPIANVTDSMNLIKIKKAVKNKSLSLVSGTLEDTKDTEDDKYVAVQSSTPKNKTENKKAVKKDNDAAEVKVETIKPKEIVEEKPEVAETVIEEKAEVEKPVEETKTTKRRKKKEE